MSEEKKQKYNRVDDLLLGNIILESARIAMQGKDLEKQHKTKIICAEICLIAENGEIVYRIWNTKRTKRYLPNLTRRLEINNLKIHKEVLDFLANVVSWGFMAKIEKRPEDDQ